MPVTDSVPAGFVTGLLVSLVLGYRNRSGISQFLGGAICCLVVWAVLGIVVGGKAALTSAIILVPLVTAVAGILTTAFVAGFFIPIINSKKIEHPDRQRPKAVIAAPGITNNPRTGSEKHYV